MNYIQVDETHIIEVFENQYYPRRLVNAKFRTISEGWGFYKTGNKSKSFRTEDGARKFLATADITRSSLVGGYTR